MKEKFLQKTPLFAGLSPESISLIAKALRAGRRQKGEILFEEGEPPNFLYLIKSGWVRIIEPGGKVFATLGPGSVVGESDFFQGKPFSVRAEAISDLQIWTLSREALIELVGSNPFLGMELSQALGVTIAPLKEYLKSKLKKIAGFSGLADEELEALASAFSLRRYLPGEFLCKEGEPPKGLFLLESGSVNLFVAGEEEFTVLKEGESFGEFSLITGRPYPYSVRAASETFLWFLPAEEFNSISSRYPSIKKALSSELKAPLSRKEKELAMERLAKVPLFKGLPEEALKAVATKLSIAFFPQGETIVSEGSPGDAMFIIDKGQVKLTRAVGPRRAYTLSDGDFFGETALITGRPHNFSALALSDTVLWMLYRSDFEELALQYPAISLALNRLLGEKLLEFERQYLQRELRHLYLFASLEPEQLEEISARLKPVRFKAGEVIFREGEPANFLYLIDAGQVEIVKKIGKDEVTIAFLREGDFFGEMALLRGTDHTATAKAITDVDLWGLEKKDFDELLLRYPALAVSLSKALSDRLFQTNLLLTQRLLVAPQRKAAIPAPSVKAPSIPKVKISVPSPAYGLQKSIVAALEGLRKAFSDTATWFRAQKRATKLRIAAVVLLLAWLCGISAPSTLISALGARDITFQTVQEMGFLVTPTFTPTSTPTFTPTPTATPTFTPTPLPTPTPTVTPTPLPSPTPTPTFTPTPTPTKVKTGGMGAASVQVPTPTPTPIPRVWDERLNALGVRLVPASVAPGQTYWMLVEARWNDEIEAGGKHNIYVRLLDENGNLVSGETVILEWSSGNSPKVHVPVEGKDYPVDFPMYAILGSYSVYVSGLPSDRIEGLGLGDIQRPNYKIHTCFYLTFKRVRK